ncbi:GPP34 family phosphoprotein [Streptomyces sp. Tu 3180]|uniref:GOLPH3/VPS74 family protein n=1 Tax=Streptomyces sp. Tu 3180 TaxID=2682611 RepID=UPI0013576B45|nr:GPP34 family phosphoprotein [Streptomyces sp. Tu 3180]KAF3468603.1 GPP34 family phosphoprotein [Streptomyces sp. Tu 3180]
MRPARPEPDCSLSPPARLYLLAWDTARREVADPARLSPLVRAGALADLARRGLLIDDDGVTTPRDLDSRTGDAVLDGLLELVSESCPHSWRTWVTLRARHTLDAVREQLVAEGVLRAERRRVLGVFPTVEHVLDDVARVRHLQQEARRILDGPGPAEDVPETDAAVVALGASAGLSTLPPGRDRAGRRRRVEDLAERGGAATPALGRIVRELRTALTAAGPVPSLTAGG